MRGRAPAYDARRERPNQLSLPAEPADGSKERITMKGKIALEEHRSLPETLEDSRGFVGGSADWSRFERQILELGDERVSEMEKNGIDHQIVSLNAPAIQAVVSTNEAIDLAKRAND